MLFRIVVPEGQDLFLRGVTTCNIKTLKFRLIFWRKIGTTETANNVEKRHVLCPTDKIMLFYMRKI